MKIIKFKDFITESKTNHKHEYGCVMLGLDVPNWSDFTKLIDPDDIYHHPTDDSYGIETKPHCTLLWGLHSDIDDKQVEDVVNKFQGQNLSLDILGIDAFEKEDFDVLKFKVNPTEQLVRFNQELSKLPNSNKYPNYEPHITISYLKPGRSKKYIDTNKKCDCKIRSVEYSKTTGDKINYPI